MTFIRSWLKKAAPSPVDFRRHVFLELLETMLRHHEPHAWHTMTERDHALFRSYSLSIYDERIAWTKDEIIDRAEAEANSLRRNYAAFGHILPSVALVRP